MSYQKAWRDKIKASIKTLKSKKVELLSKLNNICEPFDSKKEWEKGKDALEGNNLTTALIQINKLRSKGKELFGVASVYLTIGAISGIVTVVLSSDDFKYLKDSSLIFCGVSIFFSGAGMRYFCKSENISSHLLDLEARRQNYSERKKAELTGSQRQKAL